MTSMNHLQVQMYYAWLGWGCEAVVPVPLGSHWQAEYKDRWTRFGRDEGCLVASHSRLSRQARKPRVSLDQQDCPASLCL